MSRIKYIPLLPLRQPAACSARPAGMNSPVYITSMGTFLPGPPVSNEEMEDYLGKIRGKASRARLRVLKQNGIQHRHYAIDKEQRTLFSHEEMAAVAVRVALYARSAMIVVQA